MTPSRAEDGTLRVEIAGRGLRGFQFPGAEPSKALDAQNSGTTMRLLTGVLAAQPFMTRIKGDVSLSRRPMTRVTEPLEHMGAVIASNNGYPPLVIHGNKLEAPTPANEDVHAPGPPPAPAPTMTSLTPS